MNICTADIYQRVGLSKSGKPTLLSTMAAFFVSALWHVSRKLDAIRGLSVSRGVCAGSLTRCCCGLKGLSPGYYLFFLLGGIYIEVGKSEFFGNVELTPPTFVRLTRFCLVRADLRRRLRSYFHYTEDRNAYPHAIFLSYFNGTSHPLAFLYDISGMFFTWVAMQYAGVAFEIMDVRRCLAIWSSWYFFPHVVSVGLLVLFNLFPQRRSASGEKKKQ
jgi:lysophospholipid acyltransferase